MFLVCFLISKPYYASGYFSQNWSNQEFYSEFNSVVYSSQLALGSDSTDF